MDLVKCSVIIIVRHISLSESNNFCGSFFFLNITIEIKLQKVISKTFSGMSLCSSCFKNSNHEGHDFNRFFSQAGGACDCGNVDVLKESGYFFNKFSFENNWNQKLTSDYYRFCFRHGPNACRPPVPSPNIVSLGEFIIPKLFVRLFLCFRGWVS